MGRKAVEGLLVAVNVNTGQSVQYSQFFTSGKVVRPQDRVDPCKRLLPSSSTAASAAAALAAFSSGQPDGVAAARVGAAGGPAASSASAGAGDTAAHAPASLSATVESVARESSTASKERPAIVKVTADDSVDVSHDDDSSYHSSQSSSDDAYCFASAHVVRKPGAAAEERKLATIDEEVDEVAHDKGAAGASGATAVPPDVAAPAVGANSSASFAFGSLVSPSEACTDAAPASPITPATVALHSSQYAYSSPLLSAKDALAATPVMPRQIWASSPATASRSHHGGEGDDDSRSFRDVVNEQVRILMEAEAAYGGGWDDDDGDGHAAADGDGDEEEPEEVDAMDDGDDDDDDGVAGLSASMTRQRHHPHFEPASDDLDGDSNMDGGAFAVHVNSGGAGAGAAASSSSSAAAASFAPASGAGAVPGAATAVKIQDLLADCNYYLRETGLGSKVKSQRDASAGLKHLVAMLRTIVVQHAHQHASNAAAPSVASIDGSCQPVTDADQLWAEAVMQAAATGSATAAAGPADSSQVTHSLCDALLQVHPSASSILTTIVTAIVPCAGNCDSPLLHSACYGFDLQAFQLLAALVKRLWPQHAVGDLKGSIAGASNDGIMGVHEGVTIKQLIDLLFSAVLYKAGRGAKGKTQVLTAMLALVAQ